MSTASPSTPSFRAIHKATSAEHTHASITRDIRVDRKDALAYRTSRDRIVATKESLGKPLSGWVDRKIGCLAGKAWWLEGMLQSLVGVLCRTGSHSCTAYQSKSGYGFVSKKSILTFAPWPHSLHADWFPRQNLSRFVPQ